MIDDVINRGLAPQFKKQSLIRQLADEALN
jgi:hypothetical protein